MSCLVKFGFGGVQDFIAQARMTRDLAAGSRLIQSLSVQAAGSEIIKSLAQAAANRVQGELILPPPADEKGTPPEAFPHQFVFRFEGNLEGACKAGNDLRKSVLQDVEGKLCAALKNADGQFQKEEGVKEDDPRLKQHLRSALEVYWVAIEETGDYEKDYKLLTRLFDDRRHTRTFEQIQSFSGEPGNETCSQCGVRPRIGHGTITSGKGLFYTKDKLCVVCAAKRAWSGSGIDTVPNTYKLSRWRAYMDPVYKKWNDSKDQFDLPLEEVGNPDLRKDLAKLSPYWALIVFDGDQMGKWFSGEFAPNSADLWSFQVKLAQAMNSFASKVKELCDSNEDEQEKQPVFRVYTGGDDGLILSPFDFALPLAEKIHSAWVDCMAKIHGRKKENTIAPTLSLHISLLHAKEPLQPAVADLHHYLDQAKEKGGRDCYSILANVRAGSPAWMVSGWKQWPIFVEALESLTNYRMSDFSGSFVRIPNSDERTRRNKVALSARLPHAMMEAMERFYQDDDAKTLVSKTALLAEMHRIIGRRSRGGEEHSSAILQFLEPRMDGLPEEGSAKDKPSCSPIRGPEALRSAFEVLAFMARELRWGGEE
jgi:CRISPR-associated protein Cmr2